MKPAAKRAWVGLLQERHPGVSERRACEVVKLARSTMRYAAHGRDNTALLMRLRELAEARPRFGHMRLHLLLRREGWKANKKRTYRLYREEGLSVRTKKRRKRASHLRVVPALPAAPNERWSMDFVADSLDSGKRFRALTVVDVFTRECLAIEADFGLNGRKVSRALDAVAATRGYPKMITVDNGTEFYSKEMDSWAWLHGVKLDFIRPGKPSRTPSSKASTGGFGTNVSTGRSFWIWMQPGPDCLSGSVTTMRIDRTAPSGAFRRGNSRRNGRRKHRAEPDPSTRRWPSYRGRVTAWMIQVAAVPGVGGKRR
jgi:putative transposase